MALNRLWLADTLALISFTFVTGMAVELLIVGMTFSQSLLSRLMCQPVNIVTARLYGIYRDALIAMLKRKSGYHNGLVEAGGDVLAYVTFQLPLYIGILMIVGMGQSAIITAAFSQTAALLVLGAPYGQWLKLVRRQLTVARIAA